MALGRALIYRGILTGLSRFSVTDMIYSAIFRYLELGNRLQLSSQTSEPSIAVSCRRLASLQGAMRAVTKESGKVSLRYRIFDR